MWVSFKSEGIAAFERLIPTKRAKTKYSLSLIDSSIRRCYEMDKTSISMFEILEPGGQLWANTAFKGSQFYSIGVPKFYSWVNVISVYVYNDLG